MLNNAISLSLLLDLGLKALFGFGAKNGASAVTAINLYGHLFPFGVGNQKRRFSFETHLSLRTLMYSAQKKATHLTGKYFEFRGSFSETE